MEGGGAWEWAGQVKMVMSGLKEKERERERTREMADR